MKLFNFFKKKDKEDNTVNNESGLLSIKLFFIEEPQINDEYINKCLRTRFSSIKFPEVKEENSKTRQYFFNDYEVTYAEGKIAAQGGIYIPDTEGVDFDKLESSFQQTWNWEEAESVVRQCKYEILLTDIMSRGLDYKLRLELFQKFVASIVEAMEPTAIWITNSEKLLQKDEYLNNFSSGDYQNLNAYLNVRMFNIKGAKDKVIMDTIGLHSLGLPDFEINFDEHDPSVIAGLLFNYGSYIYENGVVIENGNTIQGIKESQQWKCFFQESLLAPKRIIIGIDDLG